MVLLHLVPASRQVRLAGNTQPLVSDGKLTVGILMSDMNVQYQAFVRRKQDVSHTELMLLMEECFSGEAGIATLEERCLGARMAEASQACSWGRGQEGTSLH